MPARVRVFLLEGRAHLRQEAPGDWGENLLSMPMRYIDDSRTGHSGLCAQAMAV